MKLASKQDITQQLADEATRMGVLESGWAAPLNTPVYVSSAGGGQHIKIKVGDGLITSINWGQISEGSQSPPLSHLVKALQALTIHGNQHQVMTHQELLRYSLEGQIPRANLKKEIDRHLVLIPTQDRSESLDRCLESLVLHAERFSHKNLDVIVFDDSRSEDSREANQIVVKRIAIKSDAVRFHYRTPDDVEELLRQALSPDDARMAAMVFPEQRSFGRSRNALLLLAAALRRGTDEQLGLHFFDDDTSIQYDMPHDYFNSAAQKLTESGHVGARAVGIPDVGFADLVWIWSKEITTGLKELVEKGTDLDIDAKKRISYLTRCIRTLEAGEVPHFAIGEEDSYLGGLYDDQLVRLGFGQSMLFEAATSIPYVVGGSEEDHVHSVYLDVLGYPQTPHSGEIYHWYGRQSGPIPLAIDLNEIGESVGVIHNDTAELVAQLQSYPALNAPIASHRRSLLELGSTFISKHHLEVWHRLLQSIQKSDE